MSQKNTLHDNTLVTQILISAPISSKINVEKIGSVVEGIISGELDPESFAQIETMINQLPFVSFVRQYVNEEENYITSTQENIYKLSDNVFVRRPLSDDLEDVILDMFNQKILSKYLVHSSVKLSQVHFFNIDTNNQLQNSHTKPSQEATDINVPEVSVTDSKSILSQYGLTFSPSSITNWGRTSCSSRWIFQQEMAQGADAQVFSVCDTDTKANHCGFVAKLQPRDKYFKNDLITMMLLQNQNVAPTLVDAFACRAATHVFYGFLVMNKLSGTLTEYLQFHWQQQHHHSSLQTMIETELWPLLLLKLRILFDNQIVHNDLYANNIMFAGDISSRPHQLEWIIIDYGHATFQKPTDVEQSLGYFEHDFHTLSASVSKLIFK